MLAMIGRAHVDVQDRVDVFERDVLKLTQAKNAGVVDQDVEPAQLGDRLIDRSLDGRDIRAVRLDRHCPAARALMARTTSAARSADFS